MLQTVPCTGALQGSRARWWTELPLIAVVYAAYSAGRLLVRGDVASAVNHGLSILRFERHWDIDFEAPLNRLFSTHAILGIPADFAYASLHYLVTPAVLVWVWKRHVAQYRLLRTWLLVSTLLGLIGFTLVPTCPPRLLSAGEGFVDTMAKYGSYGWWGSDASAPRGLGGLTNQYAAMPSLHVGWALWCGVVLWRHARSGWVKVLAVLYPLGIALVVMGTANHYFMDAVVGIAVMGVGLLLARPAQRLNDRVRARFGVLGVASRETARTAGETADMRKAEALPPADSRTDSSTTDSPTDSPTDSGADAGTGQDTDDEIGPETGSGTGAAPANVSGECETSARERERIPRQQSAGSDEDADADTDADRLSSTRGDGRTDRGSTDRGSTDRGSTDRSGRAGRSDGAPAKADNGAPAAAR
jgi:hypothetical protein